jgi:ParB-like chromosome segregation protein Spo0J
MPIKNRIIGHETVKARDLVPHPLNFRKHPDEQRQALAASYDEIGFARSLLGYRLPDGKIQLIDGHLRAEFDPDMDVLVEILDVTEEEARKLLLTVDPLAMLAATDEEVHARLEEITHTTSEALTNLWHCTREAAQAAQATLKQNRDRSSQAATDTFCILIQCESEKEQVAMLRKLKAQGVKCKAIIT